MAELAPLDAVDLDSGEQPPAGGGWGRRQSGWLAAIVLAVAAALVAVFVWPERQPEPEVVGLPEEPTVAWRLDSAPGVPRLSFERCGEGRIVAFEREDVDLSVRCLSLHDGTEVWRSDLATEPWAWVEDLPGTDFLLFTDDTSARLVDRGDGVSVATLDLPPSTGDTVTQARLLSSDAGDLFLAAPEGTPDGRTTSISRLRGGDVFDRVWTAELREDDVPTIPTGNPLIEYRGLLWYPDAAGGFGFVLEFDDGTRPEWSTSLRQMNFVGNVAVGRDGSDVAGVDLGSGRRLWTRQVERELVVTSGDALYAVPDPDFAFLDPGEGDLVSPITRLDPRTGRELWTGETPHPVAEVRTFGDVVLALSQSPSNRMTIDLQLSRIDPADGAVLWTASLGTGQLTWSAFGEEQVLLSRFLDEGFGRSSVSALDLMTGSIRWDLEPDGSPSVVGGRLVAVADGGLRVYR